MKSFPLYAKILLWFFLNLILLAVAFAVLFGGQIKLGPDWLLSLGAEERIEAVSGLIESELNYQPREEWNGVLEDFNQAYQVKFYIFGEAGVLVAGQAETFPSVLRERLGGLRGRRGFGPGVDGMGRGRPPGRRGAGNRLGPGGAFPGDGRAFQARGGEGRPRRFGRGDLARPKSIFRTSEPPGYWVMVRAAANAPDSFRPSPITLVMFSPSLGAGGLLFDVKPWLLGAVGALVLSALFWFPLVRGITRSLGEVTQASEQIARGQFDVRVAENRQDELGNLGRSVNHMAGRLEGLVNGQKRFLGDIAHELCSPLAKLRLALGILEQRSDKELKNYLDSAQDKAEQMSLLVNELLSFSKASLGDSRFVLQPVSVQESVSKVVKREAMEGVMVEVDLPDDLWVRADPELLVRALANLVRNAVRYAGQDGPIQVSAQQNGDKVEIRVVDQGPGVPEEAVSNLFAPFYRVDSSRDRSTGGVGLGLSIVKTCVESCDGTVSCRNLKPTGLEMMIQLAVSKPLS